MSAPERLVVVLGTGTEVGKTWVACQVLAALRAEGHHVAARKPAQSFTSAEAEQGLTDADLLAHATGERPLEVCRLERWYPTPMAPPMAADLLGLDKVCLDDLVAELHWPDGIEVGLVETAGGARSPVAHDGDGADMARALEPDVVLLVADAGLGTINAVRSTAVALAGLPVVVVLNRYEPDRDLHVRNRAWLVDQDRFDVVTDLDALVARLTR